MYVCMYVCMYDFEQDDPNNRKHDIMKTKTFWFWIFFSVSTCWLTYTCIKLIDTTTKTKKPIETSASLRLASSPL